MHVLFLYASTGSGHLKAAEYVEDSLLELDPGIKISMADVLNMCNFPIETFILRMFRLLISGFPKLYRFFYRLSENNALFNRIAGVFFKDSIEQLKNRCIHEKITHIVCTHPLALLFVSKLKKEMQDTSITTMGIITDYQIHRFWLYPRIDYYCVPNIEMKEELLQMGWNNDNVRVTGIPCPNVTTLYESNEELQITLNSQIPLDAKNFLNESSSLETEILSNVQISFNEQNPLNAKNPLNEQYSLKTQKLSESQKPFWLVSGGGWGLSNLEQTTYSLLKKVLNCNLLVVTGKNRSLYKRLKALEKNNSARLTVEGTIPNMFNIMRNALVVLTKPGGLTVTEAMILKKPLILLKPLPGAEERNFNYLIKKGAAISFNSFVEQPDIVDKWHNLYAEKQSQTANNKSSEAISRWIVETHK